MLRVSTHHAYTLEYLLISRTSYWACIVACCVALYEFQPLLKDYDNYIVHVERAHAMLEYFLSAIHSMSIVAVLMEPLWFGALYVMSLLADPHIVVWTVACIGFVLINIGLTRLTAHPWVCLLFVVLMYPLAIKYFMQVRHGLSIGIYFYFLSCASHRWKLFRFLAPFVHYGAWIYVGYEVATRVARSLRLSRILQVLMMVVGAGAFVILVEPVLTATGGMALISESWTLDKPLSSGRGVALWATIGVAFATLARASDASNAALFGIALFIIGQFAFDAATRLAVYFMPFLIVGALRSNNEARLVLIAVVLSAGIVLWIPTMLDISRIVVM